MTYYYAVYETLTRSPPQVAISSVKIINDRDDTTRHSNMNVLLVTTTRINLVMHNSLTATIKNS